MKKSELKRFNPIAKFSDWIIKDYYDSEPDPFEQAKIRLTFNLALLDLLSVSYIISILIIRQNFFGLINTSIVFCSVLMVFVLLKYMRNVRVASMVFTCVLFSAITAGVLFNDQVNAFGNLLFFIVAILYSFFTLGIRWGISIVILAITVWMYYANYRMYDNLHTEDIYQGPLTGTGIFIGFVMVSYIVIQFVNLRSFAEHDIKTKNEKLKEAKLEVDKSLKIQEQFIANTSHEVRSPLNGIMGLTRQLMEGPMTPEQKKYLMAIKTSSDNLLHIINDILDISKINANKVDFEKTAFNFPELLKTLAIGLQHKTEEKNIYLNLEIDHAIPKALIGDPVRLYQILLNLVSNAVKFTEKGGVVIYIKKISGDKDVLLGFNIVDTGIGIAKEKLQSVFENFTQAETDTHRKYGGTGLGLGISKSLIEQQGGTISVTSTPGLGSTFSFHLSFEVTDESALANNSEKKGGQLNLQDVTILVVDDNPINRHVISYDLEKVKADLEMAGDGKSALEMLREKKYDIILMDVHMPDLDGVEVTKIIRSEVNNPNYQTPIIAFTASVTIAEKENCKIAGMNDFIPKPFDPETLKEKIIKWIPEEKKLHISRPSSKITNLVHLSEMLNGNKEAINKIIDAYIKLTPADILILTKNLELQNSEKIWKICHKLKQSMNFIGAKSIMQLLSEVEEEARTETPDYFKIKAIVQQIIHSIELSYAELKEAEVVI